MTEAHSGLKPRVLGNTKDMNEGKRVRVHGHWMQARSAYRTDSNACGWRLELASYGRYDEARQSRPSRGRLGCGDSIGVCTNGDMARFICISSKNMDRPQSRKMVLRFCRSIHIDFNRRLSSPSSPARSRWSQDCSHLHHSPYRHPSTSALPSDLLQLSSF